MTFHVEQNLRGHHDRVEIRCCCNPSRLYGWLRLNGGPVIGRQFRFPTPPRFTARIVRGGSVDPDAAGGEVLLTVDVVTLGAFCSLRKIGEPVEWEELQRDRKLALKYHGDDLTFTEKARALLNVPGFEPSPEARAALGLAPARGQVWP